LMSYQQQTERIVDRGVPVLIPPDAKSRRGPPPGWDGGLYAFIPARSALTDAAPARPAAARNAAA
jgi:hypothetical protein